MDDAGDTQALALRQVEALRAQCEGEAGGRAVMLGVKVCLLHGIPAPAWLTGEFVRRCERIEGAHASSWDADDVLGRPWPKRTRLASVRRHRERVRRVHGEVWRLAVDHPGRQVRREHLFTDVCHSLRAMGLSPGGVERLYYEALRQGFVNVAQWRRSMLAGGPHVRAQALKAAYLRAVDPMTV